jgi:hypothetical protein
VATTEERWARAELTLATGNAQRVRRTPAVVIGILAFLVLAVGLTAATDLRRLQSPRGASLAWTESAVFGDCRAFLALSRPVDPVSERRTDSEICRALRRGTQDARANSTRIDIRSGRVEQHGARARSSVEVRRPEGTVDVQLNLVRRGDDWLVLRDEAACAAIGCP